MSQLLPLGDNEPHTHFHHFLLYLTLSEDGWFGLLLVQMSLNIKSVKKALESSLILCAFYAVGVIGIL
jgi:hypothetical protein